MNEEVSARVDRSIQIGQDAIGNAIISGSGNVVIIQSSASQQADEPTTPESSDIGPNPYVGLSAFLEKDADRFFGRDKQITKLWEKLRDLVQVSASDNRVTRLLPILGPSGSGKSSVARAGLIPELARRPLPALRDPRVGVFTPGAHPLEALANVLARMATDDPAPVLTKAEAFEKRLASTDDNQVYDGLRRIADTLPDIASSPLVIFVDQFEEIYSQCDDHDHRLAFTENLLRAASESSGHVSVVITLRIDFLSETQRHENLNTLICSDQQHVMIPSMAEEELRVAIAKPAELAGHPLDEALINQMISDTKDREGALPLLQFTLQRIWDGLLEEEPIDPAVTYKKLGGVGGALAGEAQRVYESLSDDDRETARRVFLGLVQLGEGTRDTRRRVAISDLVAVAEDEARVRRAIDPFAGPNARLITRSSANGVETAEVTHEALLEEWETFNEWLEECRDDLRFHRRLDDAARNWEKQGRPEGSLWRPPNLDLLRSFYDRAGHDMTSIQSEFYLASDRRQLQEDKMRRIRLRRFFMLLSISLALMAVLNGTIFILWQRSVKAERQTRALGLASRGQVLFEDQPLLGLRVAMEGWATTPAHEVEARSEMARAIRQLAKTGRVLKLGNDVDRIYSSPNRSMIVVDRADAPAEFRSAADGSLIAKLKADIRNATFSPDPGATHCYVEYAIGSSPSTPPSDLYRCDNGKVVSMSHRAFKIKGYSSQPQAAYFVVGYNGHDVPSAELRHTADPSRKVKLTHPVPDDVFFSEDPDSTYVVVVYPGPISELRATSDGSMIKNFHAKLGEVFYDSNVSPSSLVADFDGQPAEYLRTKDGSPIAKLNGEVRNVTFNSKTQPNLFFVKYLEAEAELRKTTDGGLVELTAKPSEVWFSPHSESETFVVAYRDKPGELRYVESSQPVQRLNGVVRDVYYAPDGSFFVIEYSDACPEIWRTADGSMTPIRVENSPRNPFAVQTFFSSNPHAGTFVVLKGGYDIEIRSMADVDSVLATPKPRFRGGLESVTYSSDHATSIFVLQHESATSKDELRRTKDGELIRELGPIERLMFSNDESSSLFLTNVLGDSPAELRNSANGQVLAKLTREFRSAEFSPDQQLNYLVVDYEKGPSEVWDLLGVPRQLVDLGLGKAGHVFTPQCNRLYVWYTDGRGYLLDLSWLRAMAGVDDMSVDQLVRIACEGPFSTNLLDRAALQKQMRGTPLEIVCD